MKVSMCVDFSILKKDEHGWFVPMRQPMVDAVCIGNLCFEIGSQTIPFGWDAYTGSEDNGVFRFYTGKGFSFNDYELNDDFDKQYAEMGLNREDITAEFLASVHHIEEFSLYFQDGEREININSFSDNANNDAEYKLELREISFVNMENYQFFEVTPKVLNAFNNGKVGRQPLESQIELAVNDISVEESKKVNLNDLQL